MSKEKTLLDLYLLEKAKHRKALVYYVYTGTGIRSDRVDAASYN